MIDKNIISVMIKLNKTTGNQEKGLKSYFCNYKCHRANQRVLFMYHTFFFLSTKKNFLTSKDQNTSRN